MITELTPKQTEQIDVYLKKWLKVGLRTDTVDRPKVRGILSEISTKILSRNIPVVVFTPSPLAAWKVTCMLAIHNYLTNEVMPQDVFDDIPQEETEQHVHEMVSKEIGKKKFNALLKNQVSRYVWPYSDGIWWCGWAAFYDYVETVLGCEVLPIWKTWAGLVEMNAVWMLKDYSIVSDRPDSIKMNDTVLHRDGGPSIHYRDGFSVWCLNGVRVSQELAETPAGMLDIEKHVFKCPNAEIRREAVRKIGVERIYFECGGEVLDKQDDYELVNLQLKDHRRRPYLKMLNPSIGTWHLEGVPPDITTVKAAIEWRNQTPEEPIMLR